MNALKTKRSAWALMITILVLLLTASVVGADARTTVAPAAEPAAPAAPPYDLFTLHLEVPNGARIDYLRLFFYDTSSANSQSWITTYDAQGAFSDLTSVDSVGAGGYSTTLSAYLGHVVDTATNAYVLNWRPNQLGNAMRLCGLRVAYRLPEGAGWSSSFSYFFAAGSTMQPRDSGTPWEYDGTGCISVPYRTFLPLIMKQ